MLAFPIKLVLRSFAGLVVTSEYFATPVSTLVHVAEATYFSSKTDLTKMEILAFSFLITPS